MTLLAWKNAGISNERAATPEAGSSDKKRMTTRDCVTKVSWPLLGLKEMIETVWEMKVNIVQGQQHLLYYRKITMCRDGWRKQRMKLACHQTQDLALAKRIVGVHLHTLSTCSLDLVNCGADFVDT
jgi:hypothetical protein